jgi:eukaryotic-like serine/threonine-protein kinase
VIGEQSQLSGRFEVVGLVAQGGMGDVYEAIDHVATGDAHVIVKALRATASEDVLRFRGEAQALARLDHPAIVRLLHTGEHHGTPYLVMELIDGPSLKERIREHPLELERVASIGHDVADALAYAHEHGIVHRDIKPANVLLEDGGDGQAHVADFGIARLADVTGLTATGTTMGTAAYLAPEQLRSGRVGPAADVYSLGLVLLESITGEPAFEGTTTEAALARLHSDPDIPAHLPTGWRILLRKLVDRDPDERPRMAHVAELLADGSPDAAKVSDTDATVELEIDDVTHSTAEGREADDGDGRDRRLFRVGGALAAVVLVGFVAVNVAEPGSDGGSTDPSPSPIEEIEDADIPGELEDALDRLQREVSP